MALPSNVIQGLVWKNYTGSANNLIAAIICDFTTYSEYSIDAKGGYGVMAAVQTADGVVIDNLLNMSPVQVIIGDLVETIPPYTKGMMQLLPAMPQFKIMPVNSVDQFKIRITFYTGKYMGSDYGTNYFDASVQAGLEVATGIIYPFAGQVANMPTGYLSCDGSAISRLVYARLFGVIGTLYGAGDGSTTFNLPNVGSTGLVGAGGSRPGLTARALGAFFGTETVALTGNNNGPHNHTGTDTGHYHSVTQVINGAGSVQMQTQPGGAGLGSQVGIGFAAISISSSGLGTPHDNLPPSLAVNFMIKT